MSWTFLSSSYPISRKPTQCVWCGERIEKAEKYHRYSGMFDGEFQSNAAHLECKAAMDKSDAQYLTDGFSADHERGQPVPPYSERIFA